MINAQLKTITSKFWRIANGDLLLHGVCAGGTRVRSGAAARKVAACHHSWAADFMLFFLSVLIRGSYCQSILDVLAFLKEFVSGDQDELNWKLLSEMASIHTDVLDSYLEDCLQLRAIGLALETCPSSATVLLGVSLCCLSVSGTVHVRSS